MLAAAVDRLLEHRLESGTSWNRLAVSRALRGLARITGAPAFAMPSTRLVRSALACAAAEWILTLGESAGLARSAAARLLGTGPIDLWCVKEGHTASIWRAAASQGETLCLQVPRDRHADAELRAGSDELARLAGRIPGRVADQRGRVAVEVMRGRRRHRFTVVATRWIEESDELHLVETAAGPRAMRVRSFAGGGRPVGPIASAEETAACMAGVRALLLAGAEQAADGFLLPALEVNEGDVVVDRQGTLILVAASAPLRSLAPAAAIAAFAGFGARSAVTGAMIVIDDPARLAGELAARLPGTWLRSGAGEIRRDPGAHPRAKAVASALLASG